ncbi:MAG: DUF493 family protein [Rhodothermales bacterium]
MMQKNGKGEAWWIRFQELLDDQTEWPSPYLFKFIVPTSNVDEMKALFDDHPVKTRPSKAGNYTSVTALLEMQSSDEVIAVYAAAAEVDGVISL